MLFEDVKKLPSFYDALQLSALREVMAEDPSFEYQLRYILRWYSRTYHTALHVAEQLPIEDVMQAYFESTFEAVRDDAEMPDRIKEIRDELIATEEERVAKETERKRKQNEDDAFFKATEKQVQKDLETQELNKNKILSEQPLPEHFKIAETQFPATIDRKFDLPEDTAISFITPDDLALLAAKVDAKGRKK